MAADGRAKYVRSQVINNHCNDMHVNSVTALLTFKTSAFLLLSQTVNF